MLRRLAKCASSLQGCIVLPEGSEHYNSVVTSLRWLGATLLTSSLLASMGLRGVCRTLNAKAPKDKLVQMSSEPCCRNRSVCGRTCRCGDCADACSEARKRLRVSLWSIRQKLPEWVPGSVNAAEAPQETARPQRSQLRVSSINLAGWYTCLTLGVSAPPLPALLLYTHLKLICRRLCLYVSCSCCSSSHR